LNRGSLGGETPLFAAVQGNRSECVSVLIGHGANPNARSGTGKNFPGMLWTPLHRAATQGYTECARILLANGAMVNVQGHSGVC
jgi:ankyrin repeat protein